MFEISKFKKSGDRSTIAVLGRVKEGSQLQLINTKTASVIDTLVSGKDEISHLDYSSGGKYFAASFKKKIVLWDSYTGKYKISLPHQSVVTHFAISSDGKTIFSVCGDENVYAWNVEKGTSSIFITYPNRTLSRVYLPKSSTFLYTLSLGYGFLARWNVQSKTSADGIRLDIRETEVDFTHSGRHLVTSPLFSQKLRVFDLQNEDKVTVFEGRAFSAYRNIISPSGNQIVSAEETGAVTIWNLDMNDIAQTIEGCDPTGTIGFSEDGNELFLVKREGSVAYRSSTIVVHENENLELE